MAITEAQMQAIKATASPLKEQGEEVTQRMYALLFQQHPETETLFKNARNQPAKLASAIAAYAENIDQLHNLHQAVEAMAQRHVAAGVQPQHYPLVKEALLQAMHEVLGASIMTPERLAAWRAAYDQLAAILQKREQQLYQA